MGKNFLTIVYIAMMGMVAFTACGNKENKEEAIGKSMAENLPGKWTITKSYEKKDGEWKEVIEPEGSLSFPHRRLHDVRRYLRQSRHLSEISDLGGRRP